MTSMQQTLGISANATNIASMHHLNRRPPPVHTFTPYPPIHLTDLSRPPARQPSPPRPPHLPTARATPPPSPIPPASTAALPSCSFSVGTPLGALHIMSISFPTGWGRGLFGFCSAKTHLRNQVLPDRLGACLAARLDHRPAFGIPSAFTRGHERTDSVTAALIVPPRPRRQRTELPQVRANARRRGETGTCAVVLPTVRLMLAGAL